MRLDGIHSLECLRLRCRIDSETGCWRWALSMSGPTDPRCFVQAGVIGDERKGVPARRLAWALSGRRLRKDQIVYRLVGCPNVDCINPEHAACGSKGDQLRVSAKRPGSSMKAPDRLRVLRENRERQALSADVVQQISSALHNGGSVRVVAKEFGINKATASKIRRGLHIHQRPRLLPNASVFAFSRSSVLEAA